MRLARFLAMAGIASRRGAEEIILSGKIIVNDNKCTNVATNIEPDSDKVTYKGRILHIKTCVYMALNKPVGYICTAKDPHETKTIFKLLPRKQRLFSVGRLDKNSEGLLLITNDGDFAHKLTHPKYELEKKYRVYVVGPIDTRAINAVTKDGVEVDDVTYRVKNIEISKRSKNGGLLYFTLTEGKKREIRKICRSLDLKVRSLKRTQIGDLKLTDLPTGTWRDLKDFEVKMLLDQTDNQK